MIYWTDKLVSERYPNQLSWSTALGNSTILSSNTEVISGNVFVTDSHTNNSQTVWLEGGEPGRIILSCSVSTADNRVLSTTVTFSNLQG